MKVILQDYRPTPYDIHAVYPERRFVPQKVKQMIEFLAEKWTSMAMSPEPIPSDPELPATHQKIYGIIRLSLIQHQQVTLRAERWDIVQQRLFF